MRRFYIILILCLLTGVQFSAFPVKGIEVVKFDRIQTIMNNRSDEIIVLNFWATWCKPCVAEMPYFDKLESSHSNVKVYFVSLDFAQQKKKVEGFIKEKGVSSEVILLDEIDGNTWIDKVDKSWSGAIPANLIFQGSTRKRVFTEGELSEESLNQIISSFK